MICAALLLIPASAAAQKVALVFANSDYTVAGDLANPPNDAALVAQALKEAGFDSVTVAVDLAFAPFQQTLREFRQKAQTADNALLYYAGHGIEGRGANWLVPVDAGLEREADLPFEAIELQLAMDALEGARLKIAVLDACRNNPFAGDWTAGTRFVSRGLAPVEVDDVLVIYAAAPGQVAYDGDGRHSPFAASLARRVVQPGLPVQMLGGMVRDDVLAATEGQQRPFISASITGRPLFLVDGPQGAVSEMLAATSITSGEAAMVQRPSPDRSVSNDADAWKAALELDTVEGYRAYASAQPDGAYIRFAEANIAQILDPTALGGELNSSARALISFKSALPDRYAVAAGEALPIDGVWRLSTNGKRMRFDKGRAFAVDGWNFSLVIRVEPEQVTMLDIVREEPGLYAGQDILLGAPAKLTLRGDGNLDVSIATFPFPVNFTMKRVALDDPAMLDAEQPG